MITVKEAVPAAARFARSMYGEDLDLLLEEVDLSPDERYWLITLSFSSKKVDAASASRRDYKIFEIDAESGEVRSMKMRAVA